MKSSAAKGDYDEVRLIVEYLVRERREKPNLEHYNALILSNISARPGAAWRAHDLFVEMQQIGLQPDNATCHAVLKVLAVHPDHLFRSDLLEYMRLKWFGVNEDGEHDIMAGLLREGQFEQALERLENMVSRNMSAHGWLLDMFVYMLCEAEEVGEAYKIMNARHLNGELNMSRTLWHYFLDKASALHHQEATTLAWKSQVNLEFLNPSSGICLNVLTTASRAGDPTLATAVFAHLSKRGEVFKPLHYQLLIDAYLSASTLDPNRALSILALMPAEKIQPTSWQTRSLFKHLRNDPDLIHSSFAHIKVLHSDGRAIPIAAFNVLIESWAHMKNLPEALKIYKQIHTFRSSDAAPLANAETFNHLLKCCRTAKPPDEAQASFLIGEMLALRIKPNALTYDRLILVFITTAQHHMHLAESAADQADAEKSTARARMLLDWANRHFLDMQPLNWMPRFGTLEMLATQLARLRDSRCWDVLQMAEDAGADKIEGWDEKGKWAWKNVENAWDAAGGEERNVEEQGAVSDDETGGVAMAQLLG